MLKFLFVVMTLSELAFRQADAGTCIHYAKFLCFPQWRQQGDETGGGAERAQRTRNFQKGFEACSPKKSSILRVFKTLFLAFSGCCISDLKAIHR